MSDDTWKLKAYEEGSAALRHYSELVWKVRATGLGVAAAAASGSAVFQGVDKALSGALVALVGSLLAAVLAVMDKHYALHFDGILEGLKKLDVEQGPWQNLERQLRRRYRWIRGLVPAVLFLVAVSLFISAR